MNTAYAQVNKIGFMSDTNTAIEFLCKPESRMERIIVTDLADEVIFQSDIPTTPWNFESVKNAIAFLDTSDGANLYFGGEWIGCTEL